MNNCEMNFGKLTRSENEGKGCFVYAFTDVCERDYFSYLASLLREGYEKTDEYQVSSSTVSIFRKDRDMILANYYPNIKEAVIVTEPDSTFLSFKSEVPSKRAEPFMAQIDLEDFGTSVVFRLEDGKFIIFDGGDNFIPDAEKLVKFLKENSADEKPIIAAWIITHPHCDHYGVFLNVCENFINEITVERFIYNFTDTEKEDLERIPELASCVDEIMKVEKYISKIGAPIYKAHTGQIYNISGARLEVLSSPDDVLGGTVRDINALSLVFKLSVAGQSILLCADADLYKSRLNKRYGGYIKSDILQPPHHMFYGGEIETYSLINPRVCVVPSFEEDVFGLISPYVESCKNENRHLFYNLSVEEFYTGSTGNVIRPLPYTPKPHGRELYTNKLSEYKRNLGAESWYFTDLTKDECEFTIVNPSNGVAKISVDLLGEELSDFVYSIKLEVPHKRTRHVNIFDSKVINPDALYHNPHSLTKKGVKEGSQITVHFRSNIPIVVKGKRSADYHS